MTGEQGDGSRRLKVLRATGLLDSPVDPEFDAITRLAARLLRAPTAAVTLVDADRQFMKSWFGVPEPVVRERPLSHSFCQHAVARRKPLVIGDARNDALVRDNLAVRDLGVIAYAGVPLEIEGEAIGALCAFDGTARHWTRDELEVLALLGRSVERLISLHMTNEALAHRSSQLDAVLQGIGDALVVSDAQGKLVVWNRAATELLGAGVELPPEEWSRHYGLFLADKRTPLPVEAIPLSRALRGENVSQQLIYVRSPAHPEGRWHSVNASPLRSADGTLQGAVSLGRDVTDVHELQERLAEASIRDSLTGLHNRRGFHVLAEQAIKKAQRDGHRLALFFVDLNGMKQINDRFGHEAGDQALIGTAQLLRNTFRESDVIARLGGDEYVVLTEAIPPDIDRVLVERLQANVAAHTRAAPERPWRISVSVGVSHYDPATPQPLEQLLAEADQQMYERKRMRKASQVTKAIP
jgi:diguanylate cyclase (GGDEF)-like protein